MSNYIILEFGKLHKKEDYPAAISSVENVYLPEQAFNYLVEFMEEKSKEIIFRQGRKNGKSFLQLKQYLGVIETKDGTVLEILPKIYYQNTLPEKEALIKARQDFLKMLRVLRNTPFQQLGEAYLQVAKLPLLEVFITAFVEATLNLIQMGIQQGYTLREEDNPYLKGKLLFNENLKSNLGKPYQFYTQQDEFQKDIAPNRLIKTCIDFLLKRTKSYENRNYLKQLKSFFSTIPISQNIILDHQKSNVESHLYPYYQSPLSWAKIFLQDQSFSHVSGGKKGFSLLFPSSRIFEEYIGRNFQKYSKNYSITLQDRRHFLLKTGEGISKFNLRPDIVVEGENEILIFDAKWKRVDPIAPNYGISQTDLYQLFSYGEKYSTGGKKVKLYLIYPQNENFIKNLPTFHFYENRLPLEVLCWDFSEDVETTVFNVLVKKR